MSSAALYRGGRVGPTVTDETVALAHEAMTKRSLTTATGLVSYELETPAKVIVPVITPLVNMIPRRMGTGVDIVHWKAITSFDSGRSWGTLADGAATMPSGEANPAYLVAPTLSAPPAPSETALSSVASNTATTFVDGSGNPLMWDGLIAQALNNASQGNGATLGALGAQPTVATDVLALSDIDNLLAAMYLQAAGDPDYMVMNPLDNVKLTNLVVGAGQLRYVAQSEGGDNGDLTAQYQVTRYLNKSTGKEMPIILDRYCPQGTIVFLPMSIPFPSPEVSNAIEMETNQEYWGVDFAITDSNFKWLMGRRRSRSLWRDTRGIVGRRRSWRGCMWWTRRGGR